MSHQPQQVVGHVLLWAEQDVIFVQTALDVKSLTDASHRHNQSQKGHRRRRVHGVELGEEVRWQKADRDCRPVAPVAPTGLVLAEQM